MSDLRQGLSRSEFMLVYQPKLHLPSNRIAGAESLVRWHHPQRGLVPTFEFITLAEDTGNIGHTLRWALRAGIAQAAQWRAKGINLEISINVSARDLSDRAAARRHDAASRRPQAYRPEAIQLKVAESATRPTRSSPSLCWKAVVGTQRFSASRIDDFGVGRASLCA